MPTPSEHYRLSPSSSSRWLACPYSLRGGPRESSKASTEGDIAHELAAQVLADEIYLPDVPEQYQAGVELYVQTVQYVVGDGENEPLVERQWESIEITEAHTNWREPCGLKEGFGGTADSVVIATPWAAVVDFKYGKIPVNAKNNTQLLSYASIVHEHFDVSEFHGIIVQPNRKSGPTVSTTQWNVQDIVAHREAVKRAAASDEKRVGRQCLFCPLRLAKTCQEGVSYARQRNWKFGREDEL